MKLLIALTALLMPTGAGAGPVRASAKYFAEYWVPMSDGERIFTYFLGQREIAPGRFRVRYRSVEIDRGKTYRWTETAAIDCPRQRIDRIAINEADQNASMATIVAQNLWWLVCRGVPERYRPPE